jgi:hypothetical protein
MVYVPWPGRQEAAAIHVLLPFLGQIALLHNKIGLDTRHEVDCLKLQLHCPQSSGTFYLSHRNILLP